MATSSITESFYCDDPKVGNAIVRLLFSKDAHDSWQSPKATGVMIGAEFRSDAQRRSFGDRLRRRYCGAVAADALHVASAAAADCDYFVTTDIRLMRRIHEFRMTKVVNPLEFLLEIENEN